MAILSKVTAAVAAFAACAQGFRLSSVSNNIISSSTQSEAFGNTIHIVDGPQPVSNGRTLVMDGKSNALRSRISTVGSTKKITEAMRLVAAAKVRRAQDAVLRTRPFSEKLQAMFGGLIQRIGAEDIDLPLLEEREVKKVLLVAISGDRGLCGGYNSNIIKRTEARIRELKEAGLDYELVTIGKKVTGYFQRREAPIRRSFDCGQAPSAEVATAISQELLGDFLSEEVDNVEVIYTRFVSLISSAPSVRTMLPLSITGIETEGDEIFQLTTQQGDLVVEKTTLPPAEPKEFPSDMIFEQDPLRILNSILPLYFNGQILRMLQEAVASELSARMQAMQAATDNAGELKTKLSREYNRARQAGVTQELLEIVAGATALEG